MATTDMCQICYDDKLVLPCGACGVCDKKICTDCRSKCKKSKCIFCYQEQIKFKVVQEMEDRFNWADGQGSPRIDFYIKKYNAWAESQDSDSDSDVDSIQDSDYDPFGENSNP